MTDLEISQQLAIAIGWPTEQVSLKMVAGQCMVNYDRQYWRLFDYRRPDTIWPIAERYDAFPGKFGNGWDAYIPKTQTAILADTAAQAVALAVIKGHEGKK
jgi:hypothetical protein